MKRILFTIILLISKECLYSACDTLTIEGEFAYEMSGDLWSADDMILRGPSLIPFVNNKVVYSKGIISAYSLDMLNVIDKENCFNITSNSFDLDSMRKYNVDSIPKYYRFDYFLNKLNSRTYKVKFGKNEYLYRIIKARMKLLRNGNNKEWIRNLKGKMIEKIVPSYSVYAFEYIHPI